MLGDKQGTFFFNVNLWPEIMGNILFAQDFLEFRARH